MIDFDSALGRKVTRRLRQAQVIWLTTVDARGTPQPRPVWYDWDGATLLIMSEPGTGKVRHILRRPKVALHLNSDPAGDEITVLLGEAEILNHDPDPSRIKRYLRKYREGIKGLDMTAATFIGQYSVPIVVTPTTLRAW